MLMLLNCLNIFNRVLNVKVYIRNAAHGSRGLRAVPWYHGYRLWPPHPAALLTFIERE